MTERDDGQRAAASGIGHNATIRVILPRALVDLFPGSAVEVRLGAASVDQLMRELDARWPGMRDRLVDATPAIRRHLNVFVDGRRATLATSIAPGTTVYVMTAMSGG